MNRVYQIDGLLKTPYLYRISHLRVFTLMSLRSSMIPWFPVIFRVALFSIYHHLIITYLWYSITTIISTFSCLSKSRCISTGPHLYSSYPVGLLVRSHSKVDSWLHPDRKPLHRDMSLQTRQFMGKKLQGLTGSSAESGPCRREELRMQYFR